MKLAKPINDTVANRRKVWEDRDLEVQAMRNAHSACAEGADAFLLPALHLLSERSNGREMKAQLPCLDANAGNGAVEGASSSYDRSATLRHVPHPLIFFWAPD